MTENWDKIFVTSLPESAEITRSVLEANGIQAVVLNKQDSSYLIGYCEVYVLSEDRDDALKILNNECQTE